MVIFGKHWLEGEQDDNIGIFSHWKEDWSEPSLNVKHVEKPKKKLSNQEIINIINKRFKKDKEFIIKNINL